MRVVMCGSTKFRPYFHHLRSFCLLEDCRFYLTLPTFIDEKDERTFEELPNDLRQKVYAGLTLSHFENLKNANFVCIGNWNGYIGNSTAIEIGYAKALGKEIIGLMPPEDESLRPMFSDYVHIERINDERTSTYLDKAYRRFLDFFNMIALSNKC